MELYTLDSSLRRVEVVDRFESLIWTERFSSAGDFELVIRSDSSVKNLLSVGTRVTVNNSYRVCTIEEVEDKDDSEGRSLLSIKGPSLETILANRSTRGAGGSTTATSVYNLTNMTPTAIARRIFNDICIANTAIPADKVAFYTTGSLYPVDTIAEPTDVYPSFDVPLSNVFDVISDLAETFGFGFRLYRGLDTGLTYFNVYTGADRTSKQSTLPAVIFSPALDTLTEVSELTTMTGMKNVAYVYAKFGSLAVGATSLTGFDRRVLVVDASDITTAAGATLDAAMLQRGKDELAKYQTLHAMDGQVPQTTNYRYGIDYNLGDLVEMRNDDGTTSFMRVTEQISSSDSQGDRAYPTLAENLFVIPGSWNAFDISTTWDTVSGTATWDTI